MSSDLFEPNQTQTDRPDTAGRRGPASSAPGEDRAVAAVAGRSAGRKAWAGAAEGDGLSTFLGWFSIGLGAVELLAPHQLSRAMGLAPSPMTSVLLQTYGVREVATGIGILQNPTSKEWVGARVAGDLLDLATLGVAATRAERPGRMAFAAAFVAGACALDLFATQRLAERRAAQSPEAARQPEPVVVRSITIGRPVTEVFSFWRELTNLPQFMHHLESVEILDERRSRWRARGPMGTTAEWESEITEAQENARLAWRSAEGSDLYHAGEVTFRAAPRGEGTVVTVRMQYAPPGGRIGAALLGLLGHEPGQKVGSDLRRLKQIMEVGEVVVSDASSVSGPAAGRPHAEQDTREKEAP